MLPGHYPGTWETKRTYLMPTFEPDIMVQTAREARTTSIQTDGGVAGGRRGPFAEGFTEAEQTSAPFEDLYRTLAPQLRDLMVTLHGEETT